MSKIKAPSGYRPFKVGDVIAAGDVGFERQEAHAKLIESAPDLLRAVRHAKAFFDSLPKGSLGAISCDIGALNEFYLAGNPLLKKLEIFGD